ncbi:MAG TPA: HDIG domain-containing protein [Candidatus Hydrogenedentes bacterium]|nr:HDIG domain-containing protein [Candidatus Hydrogenedentota bacterium]
MIFAAFSRKKGRLGSGIRPAQDGALQPAPQPRLQWLLLALVFAAMVATVTRVPESDVTGLEQDIDAQPIARETIKAGHFSFQSEDLRATEEARQDAAAAVPDIYIVDYDNGIQPALAMLEQRSDAIAAAAGQLDQAIRSRLATSNENQDARALVDAAVKMVAAELKGQAAFREAIDAQTLCQWLTPLESTVPEREFAPLAEGAEPGAEPRPVSGLKEAEAGPLRLAYADHLTALARDGLEFVLTKGIAAPEPTKAEKTVQIIRDRPVGALAFREESPLADIPTPDQGAKLLKMRMQDSARQLARNRPELADVWGQLAEAAWAMAKPDITETLFFDKVVTERERAKAREAVAPVMKQIQAYQTIQEDGKPWTDQSRQDVRAYLNELQKDRGKGIFSRLAAHAILVALVLGCLVRSVPLLSDAAGHTYRNQTLCLVVLCGTLVIGRVVCYFDSTGLSVPLTAGTILLAILINARLAALTGILAAALLSVQFGYEWSLLVVASAMSFAGTLSIFRVRKRGDMTSAAIKATAAGLLAMLAITLATETLQTEVALRRLALIALNGSICLFLVPGLLSPLEQLSGIVTDITLLEHSDLNNEVLSQMGIEMPATYAHSLMLGQLAEAAADAVGGNGLLARVCAYYHDIGKLRRPEYFSENQNGVNIHDGLSPRLSARAIASHVTEGAEIAREYHLPKPIVDGILEHHGTSLISFFYHQALEQHKHGHPEEADFRYPGPKPQSRETAIIMVCDAVESGVRSMKNPNEERVREFVDKIIAARSADRQFDECPLTLKDLDVIAEVVSKRIVSTLHTRITYPEKEPKRKPATVIAMPGGRQR